MKEVLSMKKVNIFLLTLLCVLCLSIGNANATIMLYTGVEGGSGDVENVLFNQPGLIATGGMVQGGLNQSHYLVDITGNEPLYTPPGGQARVVAVDGSLNSLIIRMDDPTVAFNKIQFNIDAMVSGHVSLTFKDQSGVLFSFNPILSASGANWFTAIATDGQLIADATISAPLVGISDVQQIRIGAATSVPVPEPATMLLLGSGLMGLAVFSRKKLLRK